MDPLVAIGLVAASYGTTMFGWRRVRVLHGRRRGIERAVFAAYDHRALARELAALVPAAPVSAEGPTLAGIAPAPRALPLGELPEPWRHAPWGQAEPELLVDARDSLVAGRLEEAAALAGGRPEAASLFAWASLGRLFAGDLDGALATARMLEGMNAEADLAGRRLVAQIRTRALEVRPPGPDRDHLIREALAATAAAGGDLPDGPSAIVGLYAHLRVLGISLLTIESTEFAVRRTLNRALAVHPDAPYLHLVRAHLAAALGDGESAADHLARALYYGRGEPFYARAVAGSGWLARHRPALWAGAVRGPRRLENGSGASSVD